MCVGGEWQGSQCYDNLRLSQKLHGIHTGKEQMELTAKSETTWDTYW